MNTTLGDIAERIGGQLEGAPETLISGAAILRDATASDLTLADDPKLLDQLSGCPAAAALVPPGFPQLDRPVIVVENVHEAFAEVVKQFQEPLPAAAPVGISPAAHISPTARIGRDVQIHPGAVVGDHVQIGDRCVIHSHVCLLPGCRLEEDVTLYPHVVLYERTVVGARSTIHATAVLGAFGFGYRCVEGKHQRCSQLGHVEVGADVEIGAGVTIDRGTYGPTAIGDGTKVDNQVQIAHNCLIGNHNLICSQVGIAGSATSGQLRGDGGTGWHCGPRERGTPSHLGGHGRRDE